MSIAVIEMSKFLYELPPDRIAAYPLDERDASKLLRYVSSNNEITHHSFVDLPGLLPANSMLLANSTRVMAARVFAVKPTGGRVEVLLIDPVAPFTDPAVVMSSELGSTWNCMMGGRNIHPGMVLTHDVADLTIRVIDRTGTAAVVELHWQARLTLAQLLGHIGTLPLPPYLHREVEEVDADRYQTVYAREQGSVAAPTAGLHFTDRVLENIRQRGIVSEMLTLHVGIGTFQPVTADDARDHAMHAERFGVSRTTIESLARHFQSAQPWLTVVGTTSLRTIESLFALGARIAQGATIEVGTVHIDQWSAFDISLQTINREVAFEALVEWMRSHDVSTLWGTTSIMLAPGCRIAVADALITNFHQPGNTLMLLVAAFVGHPQWKSIYASALSNNYRFLSYGDSSLLIRSQPA